MLRQYKEILFIIFLFFCFSSKSVCLEQSNICLVMSVKDDQEFITNALKSVKGIVDCILIHDLGSTDDTIIKAEEFALDNNLPLKVYRETKSESDYPFLQSVKAAQVFLSNEGYSLSDTYLLLMDGDMVLNIRPSFSRSMLKEEIYLILEKSPVLNLYHYRPHLFQASREANENNYESWLNQKKSPRLQSLFIEELGDINHLRVKIKTEIDRLIESVKKPTVDESNLFYLAQFYKSLKQYDDAIFWYNSRLEKEGDKGEVWFSKYMLGECYEKKGRWHQALYWYLDAFQYNPNIPDPLQKIATYYRLHGQNDLAYIFAKHGLRIPVSEEPSISYSPPLYGYQFEEELSIVAYYTRFQEEGYTAADHLILRKDTPIYIKEQSHYNLLFYVKNLNADFLPLVIELPLIEEEYDQRYSPMNPSIQKVEDGYMVICRAVNYTQIGAKIFNTIAHDGIFRTRNFLIHYDENFTPLSRYEIIESLPRERLRTWGVEGLEDCRLFKWRDDFWFTCTTFDTNSSGQPQISLCKLSNERNDETVKVEKLTPLLGPDSYRCEKNWLPFVQDSFLYIIYSHDPFIIYKPDGRTGVCQTILNRESTHDFSRFRGSAAPIEFDSGYLSLIHEVVHFPDYSRCYLHRFVYLDKNFIINKISRPFTFRHQGIEFCGSMTLDHSETRLILTIGIEDREAQFCFVDLDTVRSLLTPLPEYNITTLFQ